MELMCTGWGRRWGDGDPGQSAATEGKHLRLPESEAADR